jgi:hypothetical protein
VVVWEETGAVRVIEEQDEYACDVAELRQRMDDGSLRAAWNAGRALPLEEAIAEATTLAEAIEHDLPGPGLAIASMSGVANESRSSRR